MVEVADVAAEENPEGQRLSDDSAFTARNNTEDISLVRAQGLDVNNDNDPAPENIPVDDGMPALIPMAVNSGQT